MVNGRVQDKRMQGQNEGRGEGQRALGSSLVMGSGKEVGARDWEREEKGGEGRAGQGSLRPDQGSATAFGPGSAQAAAGTALGSRR